MSRRSPSQRGSEPEYAQSELDARLPVPFAPAQGYTVDELLEWIEEADAPVRFVPDWSDESYKNAA